LEEEEDRATGGWPFLYTTNVESPQSPWHQAMKIAIKGEQNEYLAFNIYLPIKTHEEIRKQAEAVVCNEIEEVDGNG